MDPTRDRYGIAAFDVLAAQVAVPIAMDCLGTPDELVDSNQPALICAFGATTS